MLKEVRQAKPLVKAMAATDRKWRQNHLRMPAGCDFKAITFQATGGMIDIMQTKQA